MDDDRRQMQDRLNFYHWCCMNHPEIVREGKEKEKQETLTVAERVRKLKKEREESIRKGVLEALLKVYNARGLAELVSCPLCGYNIGEYTWTFTNFEKGLDPIGISGVQCSNKGCLLHNGIVYESEGKRLAEWQPRNKGGK